MNPDILAFGDSLTAGYGLPHDRSFPARLQSLLVAAHPGVRVKNAGVSGDTTADGLRRLPRTLARLGQRPDLAIVALGANDVLRGLLPERSADNLDAILTEFDRCAIPVLLAGFTLPAILGVHATRWNAIHPQVAARHGVRHHPFFPPGVMGHAAMVLPDRLHPNAAAIDRIAEAFLPAVLAALADTRMEAA